MEPGRRVLHGRRRGHPLRRGQRALLDARLPALALPIEDESMLDPTALFAQRVDEVWLEIGFGAGEHLAWQLRRNPRVGIIGCEPFVNGIARLLRHIEDDATGSRVRIFADDARLLAPRLPDASIGRLFILFPDPWPKTRHHKRRIVGPESLETFARILEDDAELRMATDDRSYARWMLLHMRARPEFVWQAERAADWREPTDDWPRTRYEAKARAEGRRPTYLRYRRRPRGTGERVAPAGETP